LGLGYAVMDDMTIDLAYSYLKEEPVKINRANALGSSYNAKYENSSNGFGLGITYKF
jgi:long-chain fatty acid transport protein